MVAVMFICLAVWHLEPQLPLLLGCLIASAAALAAGCTARQIGGGVVRGVRQALEAILILLLIGALIGEWIAAGVVPAMIVYGLQLISPRLFLPGAMLVCAALSMVLGSWGTAGTVGLALMGIAQAFGVPMPLAAGAVISGSYVGDKLSPLADTTNLAAAVAEVGVFQSIRNIARVATPMLVLTLGLYTLAGLPYGDAAGATPEEVRAVSQALSGAFSISLLNFLPLLLLIVCILAKIPPIPSLAIGAGVGALFAAVVQRADIGDVLRCLWDGYRGQTGTESVDQLLTAGGVWSMAGTVSIIVLAMSFGGIMDETGQIHALMEPLIRRLRSFPALMAAAVFTCVGINVLLPDQYIAIALPGKMYADAFDRQKAGRLDLALAIGVGGALTSSLVPWNTCGMFMSGVLGVDTLHYLPFAFYNLGMLPAAVVYAALKERKKRKG